MIITLKFGPGICTNKKNCFLILKKKNTFFVVHCPQNIPLAWNAQSTHRQMNKPLSPIPARTCWDTIFRAQGASDQLQALKLTGVIKQKGQSEVPPWDIIYVQNLPGKQGSSNNFLPPPPQIPNFQCLGVGEAKQELHEGSCSKWFPVCIFFSDIVSDSASFHQYKRCQNL